jgi:DDE superfamily endonuclease
MRGRTVLTGLSHGQLQAVARLLRRPRRGRPWSQSLTQRLTVACTALRTNLTMRELAAVFRASKSQVHRILGDLVPRLASCLGFTVDRDRRWSWVVDGTLVPTRDHTVAARSKNYRWSCNTQVLVRRRDLRVIAISGGGPGNRNDTVHYRMSRIQALCRNHRRVLADGGYRGIRELVTPLFHRNRILRDGRYRRHRQRRARVEHALARLKEWRILRDHRRRGRSLALTLAAVAFLHNLRLASVKLRDIP